MRIGTLNLRQSAWDRRATSRNWGARSVRTGTLYSAADYLPGLRGLFTDLDDGYASTQGLCHKSSPRVNRRETRHIYFFKGFQIVLKATPSAV